MLELFLGDQSLSHLGLIVLRMLLAALLGALLGLERQSSGQPAGFRTHMLVSLAACLLMVISEYFYDKYSLLGAGSVVRLDPARLAAQIVAGIGFMGLGVIAKEGFTVRGLTTAACLWLATAIGMGIGIGLIAPTLVAALVALVVLNLLKRIERRLRKDRYRDIRVSYRRAPGVVENILAACGRQGLRVVRRGVQADHGNNTTRLELVAVQRGELCELHLAEVLLAVEGVTYVEVDA